jgi:hypothetical protein
MNPTSTLAFSLALATLAATSACARAPAPAADAAVAAAPAPAPVVAPEPAPMPMPAATLDASLPLLVVHKTPTCGCCAAWVEHMQQAGFAVEVRNEDNLDPVKTRVGVPAGKGSCHTAEVGGYFVEGHVPAEDVKRLLAEKPDAKGLTVPGMPMGSPGMETPDGRVQKYTVELVGRDGATRAFAEHGDG